ncbi:MAG TPA: hypothetical protein V6D19_13820 [Stenomitos sp.]
MTTQIEKRDVEIVGRFIPVNVWLVWQYCYAFVIAIGMLGLIAISLGFLMPYEWIQKQLRLHQGRSNQRIHAAMKVIDRVIS